MSTLTDQEIICKDCRSKFTFTVGEQEFAAKMVSTGQWTSHTPPVRCKPCRVKRKSGGTSPQQPGRPLGVSTSEPIREYRNSNFRSPPPAVAPSRDDKNDGRRRRENNRRYRDDGDSDW